MRTETETLPTTLRRVPSGSGVNQQLQAMTALLPWQAARVLPFLERMGVVTDLIVALDLATHSGREHLMNKVLIILRREMLDAKGPVGEADLARLLGAMSELEHEAGRVSPLPNTFNRHAQVVMDALVQASDGCDFPLVETKNGDM